MKSIQLLVVLMLSGCGVAYISPAVTNQPAEVEFEVVAMTAATVLKANQSKYTPQKLPSAFSRITPVSASSQSAALPVPVVDQQQLPPTAETRVPPPFPEMPYEIGVGDVLVLAAPAADTALAGVSGLIAAQNKRQGYTVQDDGAIAVPDVGRIRVAGMTIDAAEAEVFQRLVEAQMNPTFSLEISEFNSQRVSVGGAVKSPLLVPIGLKPIFLDEALQLAGGVVTGDLDYTTIRIYRDEKLYQIPVKELFSSRKLQKITLKDRDRIYVDTEYQLERAKAYFAEQITLTQTRQSARAQALTALQAEFSIRGSQLAESRGNFTSRLGFEAVKRDYVYLAGEVAKQSRFALPFEQQASLADALYSEGGIMTREGNVSQIYVLRGSAKATEIGNVTVFQLDARNAANLHLATRFQLRPNDVVFVAEQPITRWNRVIAQFVPSLITTAAAALN